MLPFSIFVAKLKKFGQKDKGKYTKTFYEYNYLCIFVYIHFLSASILICFLSYYNAFRNDYSKEIVEIIMIYINY